MIPERAKGKDPTSTLVKNSGKRRIHMSPLNLQLLTFPGNYEEGTLFHGPRVYIALKASSSVTWRNETGESEIEFTTISPSCASAYEVRHHVKRLIKELKTIDKQADTFFREDEKRFSTISNNNIDLQQGCGNRRRKP